MSVCFRSAANLKRISWHVMGRQFVCRLCLQAVWVESKDDDLVFKQITHKTQGFVPRKVDCK